MYHFLNSVKEMRDKTQVVLQLMLIVTLEMAAELNNIFISSHVLRALQFNSENGKIRF
jgi:hypothetical protein